MISSWPVYKDEWNFAEEEKAVETIKDAVRAIRGVRTSMNVPPSKKAKVYIVSEDPEVLSSFGTAASSLQLLAMRAMLFFRRTRAESQTMLYRL